MEWFNVFGLVFIVVIMIPNIVFAVRCKDGFENRWNNTVIEIIEQIGRFGCFGFMVVIIPNCGFGFSSNEAFVVYLIADIALITAYCLIWIICFKKKSVFKALALSVIPSVLFLLSGILSHYLPLCIASVIFAPCHIAISYKNAVIETQR